MKLKYAKFDDIPEALREFYVQRGSEWVLKVAENLVPKSQIQEFRDNNIQLESDMRELRQQLEQFKDVDPEKYQEAISVLQKYEEKKPLDAGEIEKVVDNRTKQIEKNWQTKFDNERKAKEAAIAQANDYRGKHSALKLDTEVSKLIGDLAVPKKGAMTDIHSRAARIFSLDDDDNIIALQADGKSPRLNEDNEPYTLTDFGKMLLSEADYLFESTSGGDGPGGDFNHGGTKTVRKQDIDGQSLSNDTLTSIAQGTVEVISQ